MLLFRIRESLLFQLMLTLGCAVRELPVAVFESHCLVPAFSVIRKRLMIMFLVVDAVLLLLMLRRLLSFCSYVCIAT